ncbi:hypothetical protein Q2T40_05130 [Winogradskyella maritima]|nr:hypothetical protein [Winogradskyella maritima]
MKEKIILYLSSLFLLLVMSGPLMAQETNDSYGYVQKAQPAPVKRYCQTLQLKDDLNLLPNMRNGIVLRIFGKKSPLD